MSEDAILERFDRLERLIAKLHGERLTREEMVGRLRISGKTLTDRVRRGIVPSPGSDGKWLLTEVMDWESRQSSGNV